MSQTRFGKNTTNDVVPTLKLLTMTLFTRDNWKWI